MCIKMAWWRKIVKRGHGFDGHKETIIGHWPRKKKVTDWKTPSAKKVGVGGEKFSVGASLPNSIKDGKKRRT